jgi:hypothetical protein
MPSLLLIGCSRPSEPVRADTPTEPPAASRDAPAASRDAPAASVASPSNAPAPVEAGAPKLRAEIVPVTGGLYPVAKADPAGTPPPTSLILRITNDGDTPAVLRTGGDDEGFEITVQGTGVVSTRSSAPCEGLWTFGQKQKIAPRGHLDVPLQSLASGTRCARTSHYLTQPGLYKLEIRLRASRARVRRATGERRKRRRAAPDGAFHHGRRRLTDGRSRKEIPAALSQ